MFQGNFGLGIKGPFSALRFSWPRSFFNHPLQCFSRFCFIAFGDLFEKGYGILQKTFGFEENEIPVIMFRTARSQPLPQKSKTLRLPLEKIWRVTQSSV